MELIFDIDQRVTLGLVGLAELIEASERAGLKWKCTIDADETLRFAVWNDD